MNEYNTVFEIAACTSGIQMEIYLRLTVGFVVLALAIGSIVLYVKRRQTPLRKPRLYTVVFLSIWAVFWLSFHIPWLLHADHEQDDLLTAYHSGRYEIAEGPVRVLREQPVTGHAPGDLVSVSNAQFEINYFVSTHAYHKTIAHDGCLRDGAYVRVYHVGQDIIRIDTKKKE